MLHTKNRTPFEVAVFPFQTPDSRDHAAAIVKGTFVATPGSAELSVAPEQQAIRHGAAYVGEPGTSSVRYESDMWPPKPATDIALVGHAYAPSSGASELDMTLSVGSVQKAVRVFGDRVFYEAASGIGISSPRPFTAMPIVYERAFGGADDSADDPADHAFEERNHVGVGFVAPKSNKKLDGLPAPNIEDPRQLLTRPKDRPPPAGFGFIAPQWAPRVGLGGTFDQAWRAERAPLLPLDFDPHFYLAAHPDLRAPRMRGGEPVTVTHAMPGGGTWSFTLPRRQPRVGATIKNVETWYDATLDTVLIEPDEGRVVLTWRAAIACGRDFLYLDRLIFEETAA